MQEPGKPQPRPRGSGSIFHNGSAVWWVGFSERGRKYRESSRSTDRAVAEKLLQKRLAELSCDVFVPRQNIRIDELITDALADYTSNGRKSTRHAAARWRLHLAEYFSKLKVCELSTSRVQRFIQHRLDQGAARATVNREVALLKKALRLGFKAGKVKTLPYIATLKENNARRGFLELDGYARLAGECAKTGLWLRALLEVAYTFGFRLGELRSMRVRQINLIANTITLETSKNDEPRTAYMTSAVRELVSALAVGQKPDDHLFMRDGSRIQDFRKTWAAVCVAAEVGTLHCPTCDEQIELDIDGPYLHCGRKWRRCDLKYRGLIFHDLRRCAVRGLMRAGIAQKTAMLITGHKTISTFQRYHINSPTELREATRKLETSQQQEREELQKSNVLSFGLNSDSLAQKPVQQTKMAVPISPTAIALN
jgi:integrase